MIYLSVTDVDKHYGPEPVLDGVTFELRPGERIALVGPNGTGKTTLLKILAGREDPDGGRVQWHPSVRVGYLEQHAEFHEGRTVWDEARSALDAWLVMQQEAETVAAALARTADEAEHRRLAARYDYLQQELQRHDAYNLDYQIERVLHGLGFTQAAYRQPVALLSGGEQNRLLLGKLLLAEPDVMLLDEPSNHLDIEATQWLEEFLAGGRAALVLVSHDRYFLDKVATRTLELFRGTVDEYTGNFSAYWMQKADRLLVQKRTWENQQTEIAKHEEFIRRNFYGQKAAQAKDRERKLSRIERVEPPREIQCPAMAFPEAKRSGDIVVRAENLAKRFDRVLFQNLTFDILRGERWGVLGPNGSGKTTLLRCLLGLESADAGRAVLGQGLDVGYFDQHLSTLPDDADVVDAVRPPRGEFLIQQRRDLLARFGLTGDTQLQKVRYLSGGERCRAALARLAATQANVLVLDEPTNHLDLWARDALERALRNFNGTVLFVSHDRYFVDRVADHLLVVEGDRVRVIEGNYTAYRQLQEGAVPARAEEPVRRDPKREAPAKEPSGDGQVAKRKRRFPYRKTEEIETEIGNREVHLGQLHDLLAKPEVLRDGNRVKQVMAEIEQEKETLARLYEHWEEAAELNW